MSPFLLFDFFRLDFCRLISPEIITSRTREMPGRYFVADLILTLEMCLVGVFVLRINKSSSLPPFDLSSYYGYDG